MSAMQVIPASWASGFSCIRSSDFPLKRYKIYKYQNQDRTGFSKIHSPYSTRAQNFFIISKKSIDLLQQFDKMFQVVYLFGRLKTLTTVDTFRQAFELTNS